MADGSIEIDYSVTLQNGELKRHVVRLDSATGALRTADKKSLPAWTELGFHQCPNCPLKQSTHQHCPVAVGLVDVVESFKNCASYEVVDVTVKTANRTYQKRASMQEVVGSLMGLHMASGGCPHLDKMRPLVVTHLPFASVEETLYRTVSMYLLAQYFRWKRGLVPDWEMQGLVASCEGLASINMAFGKRILNINTCDANLNALVGLDCFSGMTGMSISQGFVDESLEALFDAYLKPDPASKG